MSTTRGDASTAGDVSTSHRIQRYGFELRGINADKSTERLGMIEVAVTDERALDDLRTQLRPWALAMLDALGGGFDRYEAVFAALDDDGEPTRRLREEQILPMR